MPFLLKVHTYKPDHIHWEDVWPRDRQTSDYAGLGKAHGKPPALTGPIPYRMRDGRLQPGGVLPDLVAGRWNSDLIVSRRVRALIEANDRVPHHFVPLDLTLLDGSVIDGQFFLFVAGDLTDGVVPEASNVTPKMIGGKPVYYTYPGDPDIAWRGDAIERRQIWVDRMLPRQIFISDTLEAAFRKAGMRAYDTCPSAVFAG
ncbi:hypothetical protein KUH32_10550 [Thalassococcus sp. CAU 1522]|uniref:Immunity MXAN-0049 protein domain-containing protein n=1 Tax=Thalassococcus arenae TaxID=2851652 RepID=A0ABS6N871_9RHOB|nr:DUF1629 domain-containing protein [Thalassococcus arenae]MBV2360215.1 hypothetical protein [Thalassococcus arenae]